MYDTWLIKYTPRLPDNLGGFVFNVNFLIAGPNTMIYFH